MFSPTRCAQTFSCSIDGCPRADTRKQSVAATTTALLRWRAPLIAAPEEAQAESLLLSWILLREALDILPSDI